MNPEENQILINYTNSNLVYSLQNNYWTVDENNIIINMSIIYGNKWTLISKHLPDRTTTAIRNRWQRIERAQKLKIVTLLNLEVKEIVLFINLFINVLNVVNLNVVTLVFLKNAEVLKEN